MDAQSEFLLEIEELVEQLFLDLDELRAACAAPFPTSGRATRVLLDRIFRHVHTIKGAAASGGLTMVSEIAHELENLLAEIRAGRIRVDNEVITTCESATEALAETLQQAPSGIAGPSRRALFERLQTAGRNQSAVTTTAAAILALREYLPDEIWQRATATEQQRLLSIVAEGNRLFEVAVSFDQADFAARFFLLQQKLAEFGEVVSTSPAVAEAHPEQITFHLLYASPAGLRELESAGAPFPGLQFKPLPANLPDGEAGLRTAPAVPPPLSAVANSVRIDLDQLDRLISRTYELLAATMSTLERGLPATPPAAAANLSPEQIRASFLALADDLINLRMVSFGPLLRRAQRAAKQAARLTGKDIDCELVGSDLRLDKLVAEAIGASLIQLVRNAVDHGIERSDERQQSGKKSRGTIRIEVISEGGQLRLRVVDDGRGVDPERITAAAERLGIVPGDPPLDVERSLRLIFHPGFTTLSSVSDVSGRGVGLDIVETAVEQVGGELRVSSQPGAGATFEIRLPVTFGLLDATVVVSDGNCYCLPTDQVLAIAPVENWSDEPPLVSLRDLLDPAADGSSHETAAQLSATNQSCVVTCEYRAVKAGASGNGTQQVQLVVERIAGNEKVLVRNLGRHAGRWHGVAGATELRDGSVALVLDLSRLLNATLS